MNRMNERRDDESEDLMSAESEECGVAATRRAGLSHATAFDVGVYGSTAVGVTGESRGWSRRARLVGAGIASALLLCAVATGSDAAFGRVEAIDSLLSVVQPSSSEMSSVAWKALHKEFQDEDAELQAQLSIAKLPALKGISSGLSSNLMSSALGDSMIAGLATASSRMGAMGAAKLRILKRYGEKGTSMDNDMGFAGNAGPYSALLLTSAVVGDPASANKAHSLPMLLETDGNVNTEFADAMSENGLSSTDARWPSLAAKQSELQLTSEAAKAAKKLMASQAKAESLAVEQKEQQQQRFIQEQERKRREKMLKEAAEQAEKNNLNTQREQESEDAEDDGHSLSALKEGDGDSEYDAHYQSLLSTGEGVNFAGTWQDSSLPGEEQRPRHTRLAYQDSIQSWASAENSEGLSPNQPRSSSTPLGTETVRLAPLQAALRERMQEQAAARLQQARLALEAHHRQEYVARAVQDQRLLQQDNTAAYASDDVATTTALSYRGTYRVRGSQPVLTDTFDGPFPSQTAADSAGKLGVVGSGQPKDWQVAMAIDPNCQETLADMAAGSLGAMIGGSADCTPNAKKSPVFWPYGAPGENWQAKKDVIRQQELEQVVKTHKARGGGSSGSKREAQKAEEYKQEDAVLERDVMQATASEKLALEREAELKQQDEGEEARALAERESLAHAEKAMAVKLQTLKAQSRHSLEKMTNVQETEAEMVLREKELAGELSGQLASARRQEKQLRRESAVQRLALKRLHSAFEQGKAEGREDKPSQLRWYVPWTHELSSAVKAASP